MTGGDGDSDERDGSDGVDDRDDTLPSPQGAGQQSRDRGKGISQGKSRESWMRRQRYTRKRNEATP